MPITGKVVLLTDLKRDKLYTVLKAYDEDLNELKQFCDSECANNTAYFQIQGKLILQVPEQDYVYFRRENLFPINVDDLVVIYRGIQKFSVNNLEYPVLEITSRKQRNSPAAANQNRPQGSRKRKNYEPSPTSKRIIL